MSKVISDYDFVFFLHCNGWDLIIVVVSRIV